MISSKTKALEKKLESNGARICKLSLIRLTGLMFHVHMIGQLPTKGSSCYSWIYVYMQKTLFFPLKKSHEVGI